MALLSATLALASCSFYILTPSFHPESPRHSRLHGKKALVISLAAAHPQTNKLPQQDSDTNPNTTASSVAGDATEDGRRRRSEATQLRKSILGKKHGRLDESKVYLTGSLGSLGSHA